MTVSTGARPTFRQPAADSAQTGAANDQPISGPRRLGPESENLARSALVLRSAEFRKGREAGWRKLDDMVDRLEKKGLSTLSAQEVEELPLLYRSVMSSLSVARNIVLDRNLLLYLENLSLRAYLAVYGPRTGILKNLGSFIRRDFPENVRAMRWHMAIIFALLMVGGLVGYLLVKSDMNYFNLLVPEWLAGGRGPDSTAEDLMRTELFAPWPGFVDTFIVFANSLFRHNTIVGLMAFGLGFAFGLPTVFLMAYNGLTLGAFIALHADKGLTLDFIGWLSIHGVTEFLAIILCGAAGLVVAEKIIFPGEMSRLDALALHGRRAASVVAGSVILFFIAGFLEGGCRQLINNTPGRYLMAALTGLVWFLYFTKVGKAGENGSER
ncbi:hypothetical protein C4J81_13635 [Deltaproteobacteria bacterium Smac51]|nr:hypothetical protein C4J81_13635 [Deltaproteobacteria bacterium Smac51]